MKYIWIHKCYRYRYNQLYTYKKIHTLYNITPNDHLTLGKQPLPIKKKKKKKQIYYIYIYKISKFIYK
jgi:hypothetical protein